MSRGIDYAAYGSEEWRDFLDFFAYRTEVYDYHSYILYDEAYAGQLGKLGISAAQQDLISRYDYGLSEAIDKDLMKKIAVYAVQNEPRYTDIKTFLIERILNYCYRSLHMFQQDGTYGGVVMLGYFVIFIVAMCAAIKIGSLFIKNKTIEKNAGAFLLSACLLCLLRTALWMFITIRMRMPARITHPLYLSEAALIVGILYRWFDRVTWKKLKGIAGYIIAGMGIILLAGMLPENVRTVRDDVSLRNVVVQDARAMDLYCKEHSDCFYFEDVYSTLASTQEMFRHVDNTAANYDIMGGWACKSPVWRKKLERFQIDSVSDGLLHRDGVYVIQKDGLQDGSTEWLAAYYAEQGIAVEIERIDTIIEKYSVYRVREAQPPRTEGRQTDGADIS